MRDLRYSFPVVLPLLRVASHSKSRKYPMINQEVLVSCYGFEIFLASELSEANLQNYDDFEIQDSS